METFSITFKAGTLDLSATITEYDHHQKFKVEMVTEEPEPILLTRSVKGEWTIDEFGAGNLSARDFRELQNAIEAKLKEMYGVKNMLVLTDYSDVALNAAKYAAALTHQLKTSNLILYHSYESVVVPTTFYTVSGPIESPDESREKITWLKNKLQDSISEQTKIEIRIDERSLISAVNTLFRQQRIGLVVAGITGKGRLARILVGSNAVRLAKDCLAPLLIVPPMATFQPIKTVVLACDLKCVSASTPVVSIKTFIRALEARLLILNVNNNGDNFEPDAINELTELRELWDDIQPEYHAVNHKDTAAGIMEFAGRHGAELVITVPKKYGFFENIFHRSLTKELAYHTHLPLLLYKEDI